jgi:predicted ATP-binding protein involved in virulence
MGKGGGAKENFVIITGNDGSSKSDVLEFGSKAAACKNVDFYVLVIAISN